MLRSRWGRGLAGSLAPLPEYPRPMLERADWSCLNGPWAYAVRPRQAETPRDEPVPVRFDGTITVPFAIETAASGIGRAFSPDEALFYRRLVDLPWPGRVALNFEAVDYRCAVLLDGTLVGEHRGGYLPFSVVLPAGHAAQVSVTVIVHDPSDTGSQQHGKQALQPHGIWYTATSGIWGTVWAEPLPANAITRVCARATPGRDGLVVRVDTDEPDEVTVRVGDDDGAVIVRGQAGVELWAPLPGARVWSPADPYLHPVTVTTSTDRVMSWAGVRTIDLADGDRPPILLNGEPIFLNTPLDQGYWPESGLTPPADAALVHDLRTVKDLGFTGVRTHIKVASRRYYHHADRLGLLVVQDAVSGGRPRTGMLASALVQALGVHLPDRSPRAWRAAGRGDPANRAEFVRELSAMIRLLDVHPSVVAWVPFNESWGQFDARAAAALVHRLDPTRLIDHASGWFDQGAPGFRSRHRYALRLRPPPAWDRRAFWLSEFGGYNLGVPGHRWDEQATFGYQHFADADALVDGLASLWRDQLIPLVARGLRAAVYTQVSDVETETNGLMTYDRDVLKVPAELMRTLNGELERAFREAVR